ncbi:hypothetical protein ACJX0I_14390 [Enterobacter hormaechei subsp. xiangfangensis]|uniref:hypothetical protein n=1 Tax=Enterobacter hormaechei TaxID=158836 RepID=UPI003DA287B3|nr:hypothetical protein [Enterobacter hormaechei]HBL6103946.1 hypothetical protein [Enterobacter hormaechei]HBL9171826.1 hypothetical protein [Enterobacter hormaechei]
MITLTKEWLLKTIAELEADRDAVPGVVNEDATMALAAMKLALASLEAEKNAEPVAKVDTVGVCWYADNGVPRKPVLGTELYTAPPAPASVPDVVSWEDVPEEITEDDIALASAWAHGFNQCRAAMLRGAEPVTTDYKLPEGWVAVPIEPTSEMQSAAAGAIRFDTTPINKLWTGNAVYKAMIAAAPQQGVKP